MSEVLKEVVNIIENIERNNRGGDNIGPDNREEVMG
jgi:hypothetical protein